MSVAVGVLAVGVLAGCAGGGCRAADAPLLSVQAFVPEGQATS